MITITVIPDSIRNPGSRMTEFQLEFILRESKGWNDTKGVGSKFNVRTDMNYLKYIVRAALECADARRPKFRGMRRT